MDHLRNSSSIVKQRGSPEEGQRKIAIIIHGTYNQRDGVSIVLIIKGIHHRPRNREDSPAKIALEDSPERIALGGQPWEDSPGRIALGG